MKQIILSPEKIVGEHLIEFPKEYHYGLVTRSIYNNKALIKNKIFFQNVCTFFPYMLQ